MIVLVDTVNPPASAQDSIITASGLSEDGARRITFGGDHRPMAGLVDLLEEEPYVECYVEGWQVLSSVPVEPEEPAPFTVVHEGQIAMDIAIPNPKENS